MSTQDTPDPDEYVRKNKGTLVEIIKHSNDTFVRALCLAALTEYGDDPDPEDIKAELEAFTDLGGDK